MSFRKAELYFNRIAVVSLFLLLICAGDAVAQRNKKTDAKRNGKADRIIVVKTSKAEIAKQAEAERRADEAVRRQAVRETEARERAAVEKARRAQIARETEARSRSFEAGLRQETIENILGDSTEGEDPEVRRAAVNALGAHAGTIVVMEAQTGKILSIVNQDWGIRKGFKPCSTIKLVTGIAGLNESVIDGAGDIVTRSAGMNLTDALAFSNNTYFQRVGVNFGSEKMISYARMLGLGEPTGINVAGEAAGRLPYGNGNPRIYSHGDDFEVTPLQLAVLVSAISNGGKMVVPQVSRVRGEKTSFRGVMRRQWNFPRQNFQSVLPGMIGAVNYGTARRSNGSDLNVAGKTGSCIAQGSWVGLFASVAPAVNPKYSVVVITRGKNERGKYASAIAGKVYAALANRINENRRNDYTEAKLEIIQPKPQVNAQTSAKVDEAQGEDSDDADVAKPTIIKREEAPVKPLVVKTGSVTPENSTVFSPVIITVKRRSDGNASSAPYSRPRVVKTVSSRIMK